MAMTNQELINKIDTGSLAGGGLLNPEQAKKFFMMTFEATPFSKLHRKEQRVVKQGEIDKIAIGGRILRKKTENVDDNYRAGITTGKLQYLTQPIRLPWELTEETLRQNIEGEHFEDIVMEMMTKQTGIDLEDLHFNGDESSDNPFLNINTGWIKQIKTGAGAHLVDCSGDGKFNKATMFKITRALPNKYKGADLKWICAPGRKEYWTEYLTNRATGAGDAALLGAGDQVNRPLGYGFADVPSMPEDIIILANPQNFVAVWTYEVRVRKTTEGKEAIMQDKRFYVIHFDDDPIIQELDAVVLAYGIPTTVGD